MAAYFLTGGEGILADYFPFHAAIFVIELDAVLYVLVDLSSDSQVENVVAA